MATTIAQASAIMGQGGLSNLKRFKAHHPLTFKGGGDPMEANHWLWKVGNILKAMEITFDATRIRLVAFQLDGESQVWWDWVKASRNFKAMTWEEFHELFMGKYFLTFVRFEKGTKRRNDDSARICG